MKKILLATTAMVAVAAFALTGCSDSGRGTDTGDATEAGFAADSLIGLMTRKSGTGSSNDSTTSEVTPGGGTPDTAKPADLPR